MHGFWTNTAMTSNIFPKRFHVREIDFTMELILVVSCSLIYAQSVTLPAEGQLITAPPKLEIESTRIVWYQIPSSGLPNKFELKCQASGDSIHYAWSRNGQPYDVDNKRVIWQRSGQSGTIVFLTPEVVDQGYYQCRASNIFGVALSNIFEVKLGALDHFPNRPIQEVKARQGEPLTLPCSGPYGVPNPTIFWLFRNTKQSFVIETIDRPHITVDGEGNLQFSYVEMHDGRQNLIYQCAATSPVLHGEYRSGDEIRLTVENSTLTERPPRPLWYSPKQVEVASGATLKLMCIFSGYPAPSVTWSKKSGQLPVGRLRHENFGRTLVIKPILRKDQGVYVCRAGNIRHTMTVEVSSAPEWVDGPPKNVDVAEEGDAELKCDVSGDPEPVNEWLKNGQLIERSDDGHISVSKDGKTLKIANVQHKIDRAVYQCNASNSLGYVFSNAYVNVRAHAPIFSTPINQTVKAIVGSTADLDCNVDAAPAPRLKWLDLDNNEIDIDKIKRQVLSNGTLRISQLRMHDADTYFCDVVNKFGMNQAKRVLEVYKPTYFTLLLEPMERTVEAGDNLDLLCLAESDERLKVEYSWSKDGRPIKLGMSPLGTVFNQEPNRLKLSNLKGRDTGIYACTARTEVDEITTRTRLVVKDVPDAPIITNIQCRETQALINWTASFDNNDKITEYFVEYETEFHPGVWKNGLVEKSQESKMLYEAAVNLSPWVGYSFRVVAANSFGRGLPGYIDHQKCRTPPSFPYENPLNVTTYGTKKDNLYVSWQPLEKEAWNAPNLTYSVQYRQENSLEPWHELNVVNAEQSSVQIDGLPTYQKFQVKVRARNDIGDSIEEPPVVIGFSGEDVPSISPHNFKIININATHATFSWDPVHERFLNGRLEGYFIKVWPISHAKKRLAGFMWEIFAEPDKSTLTVSGFRPMQNYAANIVVSNSKYNSTPSEAIKFTTPEGPPGEVDGLTVKAYGAHTVLTQWLPPSYCLGNLSAYRVEYQEENDKNAFTMIYDTTIAAGNHHHVHDSLNPNTNYIVVVWAITGAGAGPKSNRTVKTFSKQKPARPDFDVQTFDSDSVIIKWLPAKVGLPGSSFFVNYSMHDPDKPEWLTSQHVRLPDKYITIDNLIPEAEYQFVVYAKDGDMSTPSVVKQFKTVRKTGSLYSKAGDEFSFAGASWFVAVAAALCIFVFTTVTVCVCKANKGGKYPVKKKELERGHNLENDEEKSFLEYHQYGAGSSSCNTASESVDTSSRES